MDSLRKSFSHMIGVSTELTQLDCFKKNFLNVLSKIIEADCKK
jgi:hypothetical protein